MAGTDNSRADRLTGTGLFILRGAAGIMFLVPGLFKLLQPADFQAMLSGFPDGFQPYLPALFQWVTWSEIIGGLFLILGFNLRVAMPPLVVIILAASFFVVRFDMSSDIRVLSLYAHVMAAGIYSALFFLGGGRWSLDGGRDLLWLASKAKLGALSRFASDVVSGWSRNRGIFILRAAVALPFLVDPILVLTGGVPSMGLPDNPWIFWTLIAVSALGGLSVLTGFHVAAMAWPLIGLTFAHLVLVAVPDAEASNIGLINILFHLLLIAALIALRWIRLGSDLDISHILDNGQRNIVVVGGGFGATSLVKRLEDRVPHDVRIILIAEENYTVFNPLLAELVGAEILPAHTIAPIRRMIRRTLFIQGQVTGVDAAAQRIAYDDGTQTREVAYDQLVLAPGARANLNLVPGMAEHAYPFKLLGDALTLRNRVIAQMERADQEEDPETRAWLGHFIVIGAGFSGVEVAGALHDFLRGSHRFFPRLGDADVKVTIVHGTDRPLPEMRESLGAFTARNMAGRGIDVRLNARMTEVDARGITLADGTRIEGATVVTTIGTVPNPLIAASGLPTERGRLKAGADMRVEGEEHVWALGDAALVPNAQDGKPAPPTAQFAIRQGRHLADNLSQAIRGRTTKPFSYRNRGAMATIGAQNGIADLFGVIALTGFPAWLLWRAYYLSLMPTVLRKVQIFFEWTWNMLFAADITNFRFTTSQTVDRREGVLRPHLP